jgi:hypothetical protein
LKNEAGLHPFGVGIWVDRAPVRILGTKLTSTMTFVRLGDGGLLVYSPIALTPERRAAAEALGPVEHLYAPNLFHHLWLDEWAAAFPRARVHAPGALRKKRPELRIDRVHGVGPEPAFAGLIDEVHVDGCRLDETVLFVRPARTLIVADLVHNVGRPEDGWTKLYTRSMGFYDRVALSRVVRWTAFSDRAAARKSLDKLVALPFDGLVVGHGMPLPSGGRDALAMAYAWLS